MRTGSAVKEDRICVGYGQIECPDCCLSILKGDMPAMDRCRNGGLQRLARGVWRALSYGVVAITELKLYNIANSRCHRVGHECVLRSADYHGDYSLRRFNYYIVSIVVSLQSKHLLTLQASEINRLLSRDHPRWQRSGGSDEENVMDEQQHINCKTYEDTLR